MASQSGTRSDPESPLADFARLRVLDVAAIRLRQQARAQDSATLLARLEDFIAAGEFPGSLASAGVPERDLPQLAAAASEQWTGRFNPRPFDVAGALEIYAAAY